MVWDYCTGRRHNQLMWWQKEPKRGTVHVPRQGFLIHNEVT